jgi:ribonuclease HI
MLQKSATEIVKDKSKGFYSRMFVVPKQGGKWRPIIDLSPLNVYIPKCPFKMETPATIRLALREKDWMTSIDLKDAYFHVPIHKSSRPYLRFVWNQTIYQFKALCFGLSTAPYVFTRVFRLVSTLAHQRGYRLYRYLDDWLLAAQSPQEVATATQFVLETCNQLGLLVNLDKSELQPTQKTIFLGMQLDTVEFKVRPSEDRLRRLDAALQCILQEETPTAKTYLRVMGHMASLEKLMPLARLRIRPLQQHLADSWSTDQDMETKVPLSLEALEAIQWWQNKENLTAGTRIHPEQPDHLLYTDASKAGWGAHVAELRAQGLWSQQQQSWHINSLELEALWKGLQVFRTRLERSHVVAMTDNTTVDAQIRNQGGTVSRQLTRQTTELLTWAQRHQITLTARHVPGHLNVIADSLSRKGQLLPGEWSLNPNVCQQLWRIWGKPNIDLFALNSNKKLPLYVSPVADDQAIGLDGLSQQWDGQEVYAYPPTTLIQAVLLKLASSRASRMILIAPCWPSQIWFPQLLELLTAGPRSLGNSPTLLKQLGKFHESPEVLNLHAWKLSSVATERRDFQKTLLQEWQELPDNLPTRSTNQSGSTSLVGVTARRLVLSRPLYPS